jgi:hypothetical protein
MVHGLNTLLHKILDLFVGEEVGAVVQVGTDERGVELGSERLRLRDLQHDANTTDELLEVLWSRKVANEGEGDWLGALEGKIK